MSYSVEGNNSPLVREIMRDRRLSRIFMQWVKASDEEKKKFDFVRYTETGKLDIIDNRPALQIKPIQAL